MSQYFTARTNFKKNSRRRLVMTARHHQLNYKITDPNCTQKTRTKTLRQHFNCLECIIDCLMQICNAFNCKAAMRAKRDENHCKNLSLSNLKNSRAQAVSNGKESLMHALTNSKTFNGFTTHLSKEFAIENLLYLMETQQLRQLIIQSNEEIMEQLKILDTDSYFIEFDKESIPQSTIVNDETMSLHQKAKKLFDKYIAVGSGPCVMMLVECDFCFFCPLHFFS